MNKLSKRAIYIFAASLSILPANAFSEEVSIDDLAKNVKENYPEVHDYLDFLEIQDIDSICEIEADELTDFLAGQKQELTTLIALIQNIKVTSGDLCVIRELQNMIGFSEAHTRPTEKNDN